MKLSMCRSRAARADTHIINGAVMTANHFAPSFSKRSWSTSSWTPSSVSRFFSTPTETSPPKPKKSTHSKLLRVLSPLNTNSSFACIEAELLRLNWNKSMEKCVSDWMRKSRWDDLIELESNLRMYLDKNMPFIELDHDSHDSESDLAFHDQLRLKLFPYELIIRKIIADAIKPRAAQKKTSVDVSSDEKADGGILSMSCANELLESMSTFKVNRSGDLQWTVHHSACSNCYRLVISGWLVLWRRENDSVSKYPTSTMINHATLHPGDETFTLVRKWMHFCRFNFNDKKNYEGLSEGVDDAITSSDIPLIRGVIKMLALSENEEHKKQSALLNIDLKNMFPELKKVNTIK